MALEDEPDATLTLLDYRRRVADLYATVRARPGAVGWALWRARRDELFASHPQSPIPEAHRSTFSGIRYFPYDDSYRVAAALEPASGEAIVLPHSGDGATPAVAFGRATFELDGVAVGLTLYRLVAYGDGVLLPFRDASNGTSTYGGGRYLIDTVKGADLGGEGDRLVLDFNFAYHPSCVHDPKWSCPLSPDENRLSVAIEAGERL